MSLPNLYLAIETPRTPEGYRSLVSSKDFDARNLDLLAEAERMVATDTRAGTQREGRETLKLYAKRGALTQCEATHTTQRILRELLAGPINQRISNLNEADWKDRLSQHLPGEKTFLFTPELCQYLNQIDTSLSDKTKTVPQEPHMATSRCDDHPSAPARDSQPRKLVWGIVAAIFLLLFACILYFILPPDFGNGNNTTTSATNSSSQDEASPTPKNPDDSAPGTTHTDKQGADNAKEPGEPDPLAKIEPENEKLSKTGLDANPNESAQRSADEITKDIIALIKKMGLTEDLEADLESSIYMKKFELFEINLEEHLDNNNQEYPIELKELTKELKAAATGENP